MTTNKQQKFYNQLQNAIDQTPKKDILVMKEVWNAKVGKDAYENWQGICEPFCNDDTSERGLKLLQFVTFNDLVLVNTPGEDEGELLTNR